MFSSSLLCVVFDGSMSRMEISCGWLGNAFLYVQWLQISHSSNLNICMRNSELKEEHVCHTPLFLAHFLNWA